MSHLVWLILSLLPTVYGGDYTNLDNVVYLTSQNFTENTRDSRWLFLFYHHSCGGCTAYQPFFSNFSIYLKDWRPLVIVGALDCELNINGQICSQAGVSSVPNLRYLPRFKESNPFGTVIREREPFLALRNRLIDLLQQEIKSNGTSLETKLLNEIIEKIKNDDKLPTSSESVTIRPADSTTSANIGPVSITPVFADDIFRSLSKLLFTDITPFGVIAGAELSALREFLSILNKLLPASPFYKAKLAELYKWVSSFYENPDESNPLTGRKWMQKLTEMKFPRSDNDYVACKGSKPEFRGYPCGLWLLFHSLTVQHYLLADEYPELEGDAVAHAMNRFVPRFFSCRKCAFHFAANSANIAREDEPLFPEHRDKPSPSEFTWDPSIIEQLPPRPKSPYEEVLWLNAVHNRVNKRLAGDATEDPTAKKIQYPPRSFCHSCWSPDPDNPEKFVLGQTEDSQYVLFEFLLRHYKPSSWLSSKVDATFFEHSRAGEWKDTSTRELMTVVLIAVVITIISVIAVLLLSRFIWRCSRRRNYTQPV